MYAPGPHGDFIASTKHPIISRLEHKQPNAAQYKNSPVCPESLYVPLGRVIPQSDDNSDRIHALALKKNVKIIQTYRDLMLVSAM